jgi:hypothetical protein
VCTVNWGPGLPWSDQAAWGDCVATIGHSDVSGAVGYEISGSADGLYCDTATFCYVFFKSFEVNEQLGTFTIRAIDVLKQPGASSPPIVVIGDPAGPDGP